MLIIVSVMIIYDIERCLAVYDPTLLQLKRSYDYKMVRNDHFYCKSVLDMAISAYGSLPNT